MYSDQNLIKGGNVRADVPDAYTQCRDVFMLELEARVVAAGMKILRMSSIDSTPETIKILSCVKAGKGHFIGKLYLFNVAKKIIDMFVCAESKASQIINAVLTTICKLPLTVSTKTRLFMFVTCTFCGCNVLVITWKLPCFKH